MFFKKANIFFAGFTILILATLGSSKTGHANELEIEQDEIFDTSFAVYYRSFIVTSSYQSMVKSQSILMPEMLWPTDIEDVSSGYGYRNSCNSCSTFHEGTDFTPGEGKPVYASIDGMISEVGYQGEYGLYIILEHIVVLNTETQRWQTVYAHLEKNSIPEDFVVGSLVSAGTTIGTVGRTGLVTGPHLHFELRIFGEKVDPMKYLNMYAN